MINDNPERRRELEAVIIPFGEKHRDKTIGEVFDINPKWLDWASDLNPDKVKPFMREAVMAIREFVKFPMVAKRIEESLE